MDGVLSSDRISWSTKFWASRVGVRVLRLKWDHPWFSLVLIIDVSYPLRRMASLNSVYLNGSWRRFLKLTVKILFTSSFFLLAFQSITCFL